MSDAYTTDTLLAAGGAGENLAQQQHPNDGGSGGAGPLRAGGTSPGPSFSPLLGAARSARCQPGRPHTFSLSPSLRLDLTISCVLGWRPPAFKQVLLALAPAAGGAPQLPQPQAAPG